jgi:AcrR family transcriptional regulator
MAETAAGQQRTRPLRRDAERNRQRILLAASEVFTTRGLQATLDDVARQAGVGVGTVYRRFPDKESLIDALFEARLESVVAIAEQALGEPDAWTGLVNLLEGAAAELTSDRGLRQIFMFATYGRDRVDLARSRMQPVVTKVVERAQREGKVRADLCPTDIPLIEFMLSAAAEYAGTARPGIWRRYLTILLDGLRPSRDGTSPLPEAALSPEEMTASMRSLPAGGRYPGRVAPCPRTS